VIFRYDLAGSVGEHSFFGFPTRIEQQHIKFNESLDFGPPKSFTRRGMLYDLIPSLGRVCEFLVDLRNVLMNFLRKTDVICLDILIKLF